MNCTELQKAQQDQEFFYLSGSDRLEIIQDILKECYKYSGNFRPDQAEFDYLAENIYQMTETALKDITPAELKLVFMAGLSGEFEKHCGKGKISLKLFKCFINRLFAFRYQCRENNEPVSTHEYMTVIIKAMNEYSPELIEHINSVNKSPKQIGTLMKQVLK